MRDVPPSAPQKRDHHTLTAPRLRRNHHASGVQLLRRDALDGRTRPAQLFDRLVAEIRSDLGGSDQLSAIERTLIDGYCGACVLLDDANARILLGQDVDVSVMSQLINSMTKIASKLGLQRRLKDVSPDLQTYLQARAQQTNDDVVEADVVDEDEYAEDD